MTRSCPRNLVKTGSELPRKKENLGNFYKLSFLARIYSGSSSNERAIVSLGWSIDSKTVRGFFDL